MSKKTTNADILRSEDNKSLAERSVYIEWCYELQKYVYRSVFLLDNFTLEDDAVAAALEWLNKEVKS